MTDALRQEIGRAIDSGERSYMDVQRATGITRQSLTKFIRGEQSLRLDLADKLSAYAGLQIVKRKESK